MKPGKQSDGNFKLRTKEIPFKSTEEGKRVGRGGRKVFREENQRY